MHWLMDVMKDKMHWIMGVVTDKMHWLMDVCGKDYNTATNVRLWGQEVQENKNKYNMSS